MRLLVSHQLLKEEYMQAGGLSHYCRGMHILKPVISNFQCFGSLHLAYNTYTHKQNFVLQQQQLQQLAVTASS